MDLTGWLEFFVAGLAIQLGEVVGAGKRAMFSDVVAREYGLNSRQALVVGGLLGRAELRIEDVEELCPGVNRRTLQRDLQGLIKRGVAKSSGAARAVRYTLKIKGL